MSETTQERRAADGVLAPGRRATTIGLVFTITLVGFESLAVATVMPLVSDDLGGLRLYGWVFSAFLLGSLVGIVLSGRAADARGPRAPFVLGLVLFAVGLTLGGLAPTMPFLVAARALQGLGAGAIPATAYVVIGRAYPESLRPRMFAVLSTAWVVPGLAGPALASVVAEAFGWRWVFLGLLPLVLLAGALAAPALRSLAPEPGTATDPDEGPSRAVDGVRVALGAGLLLAGLGAHVWWLAPPLVVAAAWVGAPAFVRLVPSGTLRARSGLPAAVLLRGILTFAFFGTDVFVPLALTDVRGERTALAGIVLTAATLSWTTGAWIQERLVRRLGPRPLVRTGFALILMGIVGVVSVLSPSTPVAVAIGAWAIGGLGMGLAYAPITLVVLAEAEPGREGVASSSLQMTDQLGVALGAGVGGAVVALGETLDWATRRSLTVNGAITLTLAMLGIVLASRLPRGATKHGERSMS